MATEKEIRNHLKDISIHKYNVEQKHEYTHSSLPKTTKVTNALHLKQVKLAEKLEKVSVIVTCVIFFCLIINLLIILIFVTLILHNNIPITLNQIISENKPYNLCLRTFTLLNFKRKI